MEGGDSRAAFYRFWITSSIFVIFILIVGELHYESFAKDWDGGLTRRSPTALEIPGLKLNSYSLKIYSIINGNDNHSIWEHPVRIILSLIIIMCSISLGFIVTLFIHILNRKVPDK